MTKHDNHAKKILLGTLIGSGLAIGIIALIKASKHGKLRNTFAHIGQTLEQPEVLIKKVENQIHKNEKTITAILEWVGAGFHLWKKIKGKR